MTTTNEISTGYIRNNFEAADRIAIVLLNKRSGVVLQRVVSAERVVALGVSGLAAPHECAEIRSLHFHEHTEGGNPSTDKRRCRPNSACLFGLR